MKGLLLKEWYLARKNCAILIFNGALFFIVGVLSKKYFFLTLAAFMAGVIPMSLISLDDQSKWTAYSNILPYRRAQLVSVKYIVLLITTIAVTAFVAAGAYIGFVAGDVSIDGLIMICVAALAAAVLSPCIILPFVFKLGSVKGRIAYYVVIFAVWAILGGIQSVYENAVMAEPVSLLTTALGIVIFSVIAFAVSWWLSIRFYEKREF